MISTQLLPVEMQNVSELLCFVKRVFFNKDRNGNPYTRIEMENKRHQEITGIIFQKWNREIKKDDIIKVAGTLKKFKSKKYSMEIQKFTHLNKLQQPVQVEETPSLQQPVQVEETPSQPVKPSSKNKEEIQIRLETKMFIDLIQNEQIKTFLTSLFTKHNEFFTAPGSKFYHDTEKGGLAKHSLSVAKIALAVSKAINADNDIVIAGSLIHDLGKIAYLKEPDRAASTINAVTEKILIKESAATPIDSVILEKLIHIALSHQNSKEKGAYIEPKTIEEKIVAAANDLDIFSKR